MSDGRSVSRRIFVMGSLGSALAAGCGGGNAPSSTPSSGRGTAQFTILWPEPKPDSRLIPAAAKSITIKLVGPATVTKTVARPAAGVNQTTVTFPDLEVGTYTATATAYPNADGTGVAQATGTISVTIVKNQTATASLTMGTTITKVEVAPASFTGSVGSSTSLIATAFDANNNLVLTGATWNWSSSDTSKAIISSNTTNATVSIVSSGSFTITATETESGKSVSSAGNNGFDQGEGLANSSWPRHGANQGNTFFSPVSGNTTGTEQWSLPLSLLGDPVVSSAGDLYVSSSDKIFRVTPSGTSTVFYAFGSSVFIPAIITLDSSDNLLVGRERTLYKFHKDGTLLWSTDLSMPASAFSGASRCINIDKNNNIFTTLSFSSPAAAPPPRIYSLSSTGTEQWYNQGGRYVSLINTRIAVSGILVTQWYNSDGSILSGGTSEAASTLSIGNDGNNYLTGSLKTLSSDQNFIKRWEINTGYSYLGLTKDNRSITDGFRCYSSNGSLQWEAKDGGNALLGRVAISNTTVYVTSGSSATGLYAVNLTDGSIRWKKSFAFSAAVPPQPVLGPDGTVYFVFNGSLYAYR